MHEKRCDTLTDGFGCLPPSPVPRWRIGKRKQIGSDRIKRRDELGADEGGKGLTQDETQPTRAQRQLPGKQRLTHRPQRTHISPHTQRCRYGTQELRFHLADEVRIRRWVRTLISYPSQHDPKSRQDEHASEKRANIGRAQHKFPSAAF